MKKYFVATLLFLSIISCNSNRLKDTENENNIKTLRKGTNWQELISTEVSDVPEFLKFTYFKNCNSIFAPIIERGDIAKYFLKFSIKNKNFSLLGEPGQCPTCLNFIKSVTVCDNVIAVGQNRKGYNFYDCNGNFLFQIGVLNCPSGPCFFWEDKFYSFPESTMFDDYAIYVFDIQTKKLLSKHIKKKEFLKLISFTGEGNTMIQGGKVTGTQNRIVGFDYTKIGSSVVMLPQANPIGTKEFFVISLKNFRINRVSLLKYRKCLNKKFPEKRVEVFSTVTTKDNNIVIVRNLLPFETCEIETIKNKYGFFLLLEMNLKGNVIGIYIPPKDIFLQNCYGVAPIDIEYTGNDEYILNEIQYLRKNKKRLTIQHLIKFRATKLNTEEVQKILKIL